MSTATVHPVSIEIDDDIKARIHRLAEARQRTPDSLMREAFGQYVEREEKREALRKHLLETWEAYRTTGLHITAAEADAWLEQLEQGQDVEPPACRA